MFIFPRSIIATKTDKSWVCFEIVGYITYFPTHFTSLHTLITDENVPYQCFKKRFQIKIQGRKNEVSQFFDHIFQRFFFRFLRREFFLRLKPVLKFSRPAAGGKCGGKLSQKFLMTFRLKKENTVFWNRTKGIFRTFFRMMHFRSKIYYRRNEI